MLDSGYPANLEFGRAFQSTSQFLRNLRKFHGKGSSILCRAVCESRTGQRGKYSRSESYSLKRQGFESAVAAAAGFLRATPTTPRTVTSARAAPGPETRSVYGV